MTTPAYQELTCKELVELVTDYLEDSLSTIERRRFDEHLSTCPFCQIYLDQIRQTSHILGHLKEEEMPREAIETLLGHFRRWR
ncbi:MAG TPA: zf-HC2 domain-containing protein [Gemmatimonadaceae bacterium]|nr:zf-HC2 domain-containing protein [Gemmatimonadaceae bacterium]